MLCVRVRPSTIYFLLLLESARSFFCLQLRFFLFPLLLLYHSGMVSRPTLELLSSRVVGFVSHAIGRIELLYVRGEVALKEIPMLGKEVAACLRHHLNRGDALNITAVR